MKDIFKYRAELEAKLQAVNQVIADMGGAKVIDKPRKKRKPMSPETREKMKKAAKVRWHERKKNQAALDKL